MGVDDLKRKLRADWRGTLVTTVQSFQRMNDLEPRQRDNIIELVDECHRSQKGAGTESYAMTMRVKLPNAFRFGLTGTPIDRTMINTHRDFGPVKEGVQERYLSYYGIRRAIKDGATLPVHYLRDRVPFQVDEERLSAGYEQMCAEMELEDEEAKDFVQRKRSQWKELARLPERINIVLDKLLAHFLAYPDPNGFKAQLVAVDRLACAKYKEALDAKLKERGLPAAWSDVIISEAQNDEPELERFHYGKQRQDELIDYFKLTPKEWEKWNRERHGEAHAKWRAPLKILIVCDRLNLNKPGEYELFVVLRAHAQTGDEQYLADCARRMVGHLRSNQLLAPGWSDSRGGRMRVEQSLLAESWNPAYAALGFDPDADNPSFLKPATDELARIDGQT